MINCRIRREEYLTAPRSFNKNGAGKNGTFRVSYSGLGGSNVFDTIRYSSRRILQFVGIIVLLAAPVTVLAHGELHIRIGEITQQIDKATNNLAKLYFQRAELHREDGTFEEAWQDYDRAAKIDPKLRDIDFGRARTLAAQGKLIPARNLFDDFLRRNPKHAKALIERARLELRQGEKKSAITDYKRGVELDAAPEPEVFLELARIQVAEGKSEAALSSLDAGIKELGAIVLLQSEAVDLELQAKRTDAALARIDTLIQREPRKERWHARRGDVLLAAGRGEEARQAYNLALGSIKLLPHRLQLNPPMQTLQAEINTALSTITNSPGRIVER